MTALQLYKFVKENDLEFHWYEKDGENEVVLHVSFDLASEFAEMIEVQGNDHGCIECNLTPSSIAVDMVNECLQWGIDPKEVFPKEDEK